MNNTDTANWISRQRLEKKALTIVAYTTHYFGDDYVRPFELPCEWGTPITCNFTNDLSLASKADALWFHGPTITDIPRHKSPGQAWVLMSMESERNYPMLSNKVFLNLFDIVMTYRLDSDVPAIYPNWKHYGDFMKPPLPAREKNKNPAIAVYIASNPVKHRDEYARQLSNYIPLDSLGKCLRNKQIADFVTGQDTWARGGFQSILDVLPNYKFYLAFENSISKDYVCERIFHALAAGTVPIYYGAENIEEFLPASDAAINVSDFSSPKELAQYLIYLDQNDRAYEKHLRWKIAGYSDRFKKLLNVGNIDPRYRMALKLAHGCSRECICGGRIRL